VLGNPGRFLQVYPGWAGHPDGFLQVNPGWAGHPDGFLQVKFKLCHDKTRSMPRWHECFQAKSLQKRAKIDGMLECAEMDRLRNRAKKRLVSNLRKKRKARRSGYARRKLWYRVRRDDNRSYR
jgi:hypothetical protein